MKRKLAWIAVLGLIVGFLAILWLLKDDRINQANYERIRLGMTLAEVRAILGSPGSDVDAPGTGFNDAKKRQPREIVDLPSEGTWDVRPGDNEPRRRWAWQGQNGAIMIRLDQDDKVTDRMLIRLKPLGFFERVRALLPW